MNCKKTDKTSKKKDLTKLNSPNKINSIYNTIYCQMYENYGPQGWWPLLDLEKTKKFVNPTKTGSIQGYHPKDNSYPKNDKQCFEICIGAILAQNTAWPNVEKALTNLEKLNCINPKKLIELNDKTLKQAIRPAGYFNQKAKKLKIFSEFYSRLNGCAPKRDELLGVWGIGPETADSILLYAYKTPIFVVDAYTKRIFFRLGLIAEKASYEDVQKFIMQNFKNNFEDVQIFNEYHALIVEHAKQSCQKKPLCQKCILKKMCKFGKNMKK